MRVVFVGVGEAFDETLPNTSLWVEAPATAGTTGTADAGRRRTVLLDCGFTAAAALFACPALTEADRATGPEAVWISHFHGDHYFGLPYLLARWHEAGRTAPLAVWGGAGAEGRLPAVVDLAYPSLRAKLTFPLCFAAVRPGEDFSLAGLAARTAVTGHGAPCLALRLETGAGTLYYSGDGAPTEACRELARGCDLVVQEAYGLGAGIAGHGSVAEALEAARTAGAGTLALVHVRRELRREQAGEIRRLVKDSEVRAYLPEPGEIFVVN
ncbi:beta-lactamase domain protein [Solidesulfovibrio carbinoliphilus subsp. oakridgensis]|uniref:Beta-lactamase domain protein n=1 Tax=Solidesulfovibrio carbinoliphilus subsp. oakridgensis TaxID=694327 RepID=G7Q6C0_9BACT|nr:MBL fold metallo-hydrolase [Solidesulfovibrio carbinoliphilus]EHJ47293.1 beta-lactamase domain protein [Solidesulfovibrio carbinoliphilus subsp. oakridgensis]